MHPELVGCTLSLYSPDGTEDLEETIPYIRGSGLDGQQRAWVKGILPHIERWLRAIG